LTLIAIGYIKTASSCGIFTLKIVVEFLIDSERSVRWPSYGDFFLFTLDLKKVIIVETTVQ